MSEEKKEFPTAVAAPEGDVVPLTLTMVGDLLSLSRESPRRRMIQCLHKSPEAGVHKMFNALQPGTYVMPHRHFSPPKTESVLVISGSLLFVEFTDDGEIQNHTLVQPGTEIFGVDVAPHVIHTYIALKPDTLIFEVKDGPYEHDADKDIPAWAPVEGTPEATTFLLNLLKDLAELTGAAAKEAQEGAESGEEPEQ
ncbi:cupin fold metalloprotein, WbuC family [Pseudodesulfovibrio cashew]|uniref:Cupin fold metalloprotein, WbuC family n=1 Tax=Pseudodesulfovibrio cashew TaxID=2678688 RepID=A0A6I6JDR7_9BACT|nr:WbuC family cupin fold metalloprotein [Pseudodesulfovibrio cashew]QGY39319.1 cupin fold metalloprotein, WbuC family [Pseudodesulfovibrio cashew]